MRCSGSPTTSTAAEATTRVASALLFREILRPLVAGLGPLADVALGPLSDALARRAR
jgi:hypothetical protein